MVQEAIPSRLSDAEAEAAETQVWIEFSAKSGYLDPNDADKQYDFIQGKTIQKLSHPDQWCIRYLPGKPEPFDSNAGISRHRVSLSPLRRITVSPPLRISLFRRSLPSSLFQVIELLEEFGGSFRTSLVDYVRSNRHQQFGPL